MWSTSVITEFSRIAAVKAAAYDKEPYQPASADECLAWGETFPFIPDLGQYRPDGWKLVEHEMADASGFGAEWEPALTPRQVRQWCAERVSKDPTAGFAIIEVGQFQVVIGYFTQDPDIAAEEVAGYQQGDFEIDYCPHCGDPIDSNKDIETCPWCENSLTDEDEDEDEDNWGDEYYDDDELEDDEDE